MKYLGRCYNSTTQEIENRNMSMGDISLFWVTRLAVLKDWDN